MMRKWIWLVLAGLMLQFGAMADAKTAEVVVREDLAKYFAGLDTGTFILYDAAKARYLVYNEPQSMVRLSPCSTFKIYNSLAGLETGVLDREDVYTLFKWNGTQYSFPAWNRDQTLASATRDSVVWYFQELATRIGPEQMQAFLDRIGYGNRDISGGLTTFWLRSSLQISAREQVDLLYRLVSGKLPVASANLKVVRNNLTLLDESGVRLMGKTGSGYQDNKWSLGWFVGWVEKQGRRYCFATNIQAPDGASGGKAREITLSILKELKLLK